ncbi:MAG: ATP-dependent Clp protease ATP-binding subunit [Patescibacteria group bacterium]|nr:ATP-dependent Clp protease ATP-binding subunit [Patescibacteria group bacterium]MCL5224067.1 ATP-dependent Clp protease ATP-binding subunit [Patescibacteria group bacterium]
MESPNFYFEDPRLNMSLPARTIINIVMWVWTVVLVTSTAIFLLSGVAWMRALGLLLVLYLADRFIRRNRSNKPLRKIPKDGDINLADYMSPQAVNLMLSAFSRAQVFGGHPYLHLAKDLLVRSEVDEALRRLDVSRDELGAKLVEHLNKSLPVKYNREQIAKLAKKLTLAAALQASNGQTDEINPADLFAGISAVGELETAKVFDLFQIASGDLEKALIFGRFKSSLRFTRLPSSLGGFARRAYRTKHRFMNRAWTARPTPALDRVSSDLTDMARAAKVGFMIGHHKEYERLVNIISRPDKPNALLIGDPGVGKATVIDHLAYMINRDEVPPPLFDKRLVALDMNALLAGADQGEIQRRIKVIFSEIASAGNIILYIPDIHNLSRTSPSRELSAANTLLPLVVSNDFPTIGTTYPKEYKQFIETDSVFASSFQEIQMDEVSEDEAERIMVYDSVILEKIYKVRITYAAIKNAVQLARRYFREKLLPSSADDLLKEALTEANRSGEKSIGSDDIARVAERRARVPIHKAGNLEREQLLHLEDIIHEQFIDQEVAVKSVSRALREYRSGLVRRGGPINSFLFVGPTGVGKTELSKILARVQFGSESAMIRFDMSEYQDKGSAMRLIGSPDGAVAGLLTDAVIEHPYSLVLLDEFEKANPDILNLFLQVFDDGRLTDNLGRTVSFENTMIIATSNAHSEFIKDELAQGKSMEEISSTFKSKLTDVFHPELLNRMTVIVFRNLGPADIANIAKFQIDELRNTLKNEKGIELNVPTATLTKLAEWGYDPVFGARPLREVISEKLRGPLSEMILSTAVERGAVITAVVEGDKIGLDMK